MARKKAQIQMGESVTIIIILLIIMIIGFVFYSNLKSDDIRAKQSFYDDLDIIKLSQVVYSLPEIQCSFAEVTDYGCIDSLKFEYLASMINDSFEGSDKEIYFYYRDLFGRANISLQRPLEDADTIKLYETNNTGTSGKSIIYLPVVLYNPINETNEFGVLVVEKYS